MASPDRMPPLDPTTMTPAQAKAAQALTDGPRGGVRGPFIPLLRSPELMDRLQKLGEYLRFHSALPARISELVILAVARQWTQQFEWSVHVALAREAGVKPQTLASLSEGRRPDAMAIDEEIAYDFCAELVHNKGVADATYRRAVQQFGEQGVIDMLGLIGYFTTVSMVMNVACTPAPKNDGASMLPSLPT